jgi:hypothetical protein
MISTMEKPSFAEKIILILQCYVKQKEVAFLQGTYIRYVVRKRFYCFTIFLTILESVVSTEIK